MESGLIQIPIAVMADVSTYELSPSVMDIDPAAIVLLWPRPAYKVLMIYLQGLQHEWVCWDPDGALAETLRKAKAPQPNPDDVKQAWSIARANGYKGQSLSEWAQMTLTLNSLEAVKTRSYRDGFELWMQKAEAANLNVEILDQRLTELAEQVKALERRNPNARPE